MDHFHYQDKTLYVEEISIPEIIQQYGTPCYIYSRATLERHWHAFNDAFGDYPHLICYSVKANGNLALLNLFARIGSGFDVVSVGELERVIAAGGDPKKIVFSGVGKQEHEIRRALEVEIYCFNVESVDELHLLQNLAKQMGKTVSVSLRINPNVDAKTHPYIATGLKENKFGIDLKTAEQLYFSTQKNSHLKIVGVDCHIGSQLTELAPFLEALDSLLALVQRLKEKNIFIKHLNLGGGLGVRYKNETPPHPREYAEAVKQKIKNSGLEIILEPGRAIAANAGILVTQVLYLKNNEDKHFAIVDAAMNDLVRPALYNAWQNIIPVQERENVSTQCYDIVGPVCETGDFLGKNRELSLVQGDLLAIRTAGAYGFCMSSNYNARPRPPEILVDKNLIHLARRRENIQELFANEYLLHN